MGLRRVLIQGAYWTIARIILFLTFQFPIQVYLTDDEVDYSEYLGPDYRKNQKLPKKVSTVVIAPH